MIAPILSWDHSVSWDVPKVDDFMSGGSGKSSDAKFDISIECDSEDHYLEGFAF